LNLGLIIWPMIRKFIILILEEFDIQHIILFLLKSN
jgi:hypothetical protein